MLGLGTSLGIVWIPGIGLIYTKLVCRIPANFTHFVTNIPVFHQVLVFICIKLVPLPYVPPKEHFHIGRAGPKEYRLYRCIVRYGYRDVHGDTDHFEDQLILNLGEFIRSEAKHSFSSDSYTADGRMAVIGTPVHGMESILSYEATKESMAKTLRQVAKTLS